VLYIDDKLPRHPKILKAGEILGGDDGAGRALALWLDALSYAKEQLTDGVVPRAFVRSSPLVREPLKVARALADRRVGLWKVVRGGFVFHDYHDWNRSAKQVKEIREKWRKKKAAQRRGENGQYRGESPAMSPGDTAVSPRDSSRDSRVRDPRSTVRTSTNKPRSIDRGSEYRPCTNRFAVLAFQKKPMTRRVLCAMVRAEIAADPDGTYADWTEGVKIRLARQGFAYPTGSALSDAIESVEIAMGRRPRPPRVAAGGRRQ